MSHEPGSRLRRRRRVLPPDGLNTAGPRSLRAAISPEGTSSCLTSLQVRRAVAFLPLRAASIRVFFFKNHQHGGGARGSGPRPVPSFVRRQQCFSLSVFVAVESCGLSNSRSFLNNLEVALALKSIRALSSGRLFRQRLGSSLPRASWLLCVITSL